MNSASIPAGPQVAFLRKITPGRAFRFPSDFNGLDYLERGLGRGLR